MNDNKLTFDEWYTRAVEDSGYTHDLYRFRALRATGSSDFPTIETSAYVIKHKGRRLEPEEVISRLQRLSELEERPD